MSLSAVVCAVVALVLVAMETEACSCYPKTLSEYYCDSDFALKAWVSNWTSEGTPPAAVSTYTLNIVRAFKVPFGYRNKTELTVHSVDSDAMCGMNPGHNYRSLRKPLNPYKRYFITVNVREDGQLWGELCQNTYRRWRQLSCEEKKEIRHFKNMKCRT